MKATAVEDFQLSCSVFLLKSNKTAKLSYSQFGMRDSDHPSITTQVLEDAVEAAALANPTNIFDWLRFRNERDVYVEPMRPHASNALPIMDLLGFGQPRKHLFFIEGIFADRINSTCLQNTNDILWSDFP